MKRLTFIITGILSILTMAKSMNGFVGTTPPKEKETKDTIASNVNGNGMNIILDFEKGEAHNYPTFAIWIQDLEGNFVQTLFVTQYFATGIYGHADAGNQKWDNQPGESLRKAALPYWAYNRNIISRDSIIVPTPENPVADAYTGATPKGNFYLKTKTDDEPQKQFRLLLEINQPWDWNEYWTNHKFPGNEDYMSSCQPSLVYAVIIDLTDKHNEYYLNPIGHGHYAGDDGVLYTNLQTHTTALNIVKQVKVIIEKE